MLQKELEGKEIEHSNNARTFTRVITKPLANIEAQRIPVVELNGVYVYLVDNKIIVTEKELYSF